MLEGEIKSEPIVALRASAILAVTFEPGKCPPSPGFAPCPIFISIKFDEFSSSAFTPNRPDATCCPRVCGYFPI
ncbi:hypothetical protein protein, partial [Bacillus cereus G9241]